MKKFVMGLLLVALAVWYFIDFEPPVVDYPTAGQNIIAFGDSLVAGYGASPGNVFVSILSARLGHPIVNAGRNGDTTQSGLERLEKDVLSQDPRIVILLLGGNDALRKVPVNETFDRLADMIDQIHGTGAAVILVGVRGSLFGDKYEDEFEALAETKQVNYVPDILSGILGHPSLMADAIHPNNDGNLLMADRLEPVLRALLE
ncbi:GDSL-type esterase/lipase family protein [Acidobacteria bacterium AH-259-D05]|nr:GDSL-type esterase/lipase family protein [Acidobacteria bacterium AH-259-D05]